MQSGWTVHLSSRVARQLLTYRELTNLEMGGMGLVSDAELPDPTKPHAFFVTQAWAMSAGEETSAGYCEIPADDRANLM